MAKDPKPPTTPGAGGEDWDKLVNAVGAVLNPLAQAQSETQIEAIKAQDRQHERNTQAWLEESKRNFWFAIVALVMAAGLVVFLSLTLAPQAALYALTYFGGAVSGFAYARIKQPRAGN